MAINDSHNYELKWLERQEIGGGGSHIDMVYVYVPAFWGAFWYSDRGVFIRGAQNT